MKLKVTIDIFSGRENPVIILDSKESSSLLNKIQLGSKLKSNEAFAPPVNLGYRGLLIEQMDSKSKDIPERMVIADNFVFADGTVRNIEDKGAEDFILKKLNKVKNIKPERGIDSILKKEINSFKLRKIKITDISKFIVVCKCAPVYEPSWWNDNGQIQWNNNCYNYACNYRTDTFAQPGKAASAQYTSLSGCSVASGQKSAKMGAVSDCLIDNPTANNKCPSSGHLVALVIWPGVDFHWYRKGQSGKWSHKPGGTQVTNLDNSGNNISDPRTADRGGYTQFCTFMKVKHGHIKIK